MPSLQPLSNAGRFTVRPVAVLILLSFAAGFALPFLLRPVLPPADPGFSYVAIVASFVVNLGCLALTLAWLPAEIEEKRLPNLSAFAVAIAVSIAAHAGLWASPLHRESLAVFAALACLAAAQSAALLAIHALVARFFAPPACTPRSLGEISRSVLCVLGVSGAASLLSLAFGAFVFVALGGRLFFGASDRTPKTICALVLTVLTCALFWTREPIQRLARSGGNGATHASYFADGVVKLSPPTAVAATWYENSDGARAPESPTSRRFDLIHAPLTYGVWIGSYQAVASPEILPKGSGDFYNPREFTPGVALSLLAWAMPLLLLCDLLRRAERRFRSPLPLRKPD